MKNACSPMPKNSASKCPTPNANCGTTCATVAWAGANFAVKNRLVRMWAISSVTSQNWWWKPTAGNISNRPLMMPNAAAISSRAAKASCASGTTTSCNAPRRYWKPSCANGKNWTGIERGMLWEAAALAAALSGSTLDEASVTPSPQPLSQGERGLIQRKLALGRALHVHNLSASGFSHLADNPRQKSPSPSGRGVGERASNQDKTPRPHHFAHKASHPCKIRRVFLTHF